MDPNSPESMAWALAQTHQAPPPPNPALSMVQSLMGGAGAFASGGLHGLAQQQGMQTPEWSDKVGDFFQNPDVQTAMGMTKAVPNAVKQKIIEMNQQGHSWPDIARALGPPYINNPSAGGANISTWVRRYGIEKLGLSHPENREGLTPTFLERKAREARVANRELGADPRQVPTLPKTNLPPADEKDYQYGLKNFTWP